MSAPRIVESQLIDLVAELIGADAFQNLQQNLGGSRLFIPQKIGAHHPISVAIGLDLARLLCDAHGGEELLLPLTVMKHKGIVTDLKAGMSVAKVASKYWCTMRNVYYVKARLAEEGEPDQGELF